MNRRYFLMSSAAVASTVRSSALASPNETVRVACVGFNARGEAHLHAYPRIPNTEIVAREAVAPMCHSGSSTAPWYSR